MNEQTIRAKQDCPRCHGAGVRLVHSAMPPMDVPLELCNCVRVVDVHLRRPETSEIFGEGWGACHDWEKLATSVFRVTSFRCKQCGRGFEHAYGVRPDIHDAMRAQGVPDTCP